MNAVIPVAKTSIPPLRPGRIDRPLLGQQLAGCLAHRLTLLSAPAGSGKTTLLAGLRGLGVPLAWVSLDEGDNDPVRFWTCLALALENVFYGVGTGLRAMLAAPVPQPPALLGAVLADALAGVPASVVVALDDYHVIQSPPIHEGVSVLLEHLPGNVHMVIATRHDPPLPLPRLRARGQLLELRFEDLRFTGAEAGQFLADVMGLRLAPELVSDLESRTEGWAAGLQLAALSLRGVADAAQAIGRFSGGHRFLVDYLADEVLQRQPHSVQSFLLDTCVLDRLTAPLCDALTGREDGAATLEALERANLFLLAEDEERRWYRYHRLFADFLRERLRRSAPERLPGLHRAAAEWFEQNGMAAGAVDHALAAGDFGGAARLMAALAGPMVRRGEAMTVLTWTAALPAETVQGEPLLCLARAWALVMVGRLDDASRSLDEAYGASLDGSPLGSPGWAPLRAEVAALRATMAGIRMDVGRAIALATEALEGLPPSDYFLRSVLGMSLGTAHFLTGQPKKATPVLEEAVALAAAGGNLFVELMTRGALGQAREAQGRLRAAAEHFRQMMTLEGTQRLPAMPPAARAYAAIGLAGILYKQGDLDGAEAALAEGLPLARQWGSRELLSGGYETLCQVRLSRGDLDGAAEALAAGRGLGAGGGVGSLLQVRLWLAGSDLASARQWAEAAALADSPDAPGAPGGPVPAMRIPRTVALARVFLADGRVREAIPLLEQLLPTVEAGGWFDQALEVRVLLALARQEAEPLRPALALAESEGYVTLFVDEGAPMARLLASLTPTPYVRRLLEALGSQPAGLVEPLTEREREVLALAAEGLSNAEIAQKLVITEGTVKIHLSRVFGKLDVHSRSRAVARAREMGLV